MLLHRVRRLGLVTTVRVLVRRVLRGVSGFWVLAFWVLAFWVLAFWVLARCVLRGVLAFWVLLLGRT
jgi:hypothetical protein